MVMSENTVKLTIDGVEVEALKGTSILETAKSMGINIPHFCYHPSLTWSGQCRMCFVEVEKMPKLATSCCTTVGEGMVVHTNTDKVREARRAVLEFILLHHPIDCPICDQAGECKLQNYYMDYGLYDAKMELKDKDHHAKVLRLGEQIVLDRERCVLCYRCVRFCSEVSKSNALKQQWRGGHTEITSFQDGPINDPYSGNLADLCPVGALTSAKFRFKCRSWFLESANSVCAGCSTGCNIRIDSYKNEIQRYVPCRNDKVNKCFICDEGRMSWTALQNATRLTNPLIKIDGAFQKISWDEAYGVVINKLKAAGKDVSGVASAQASNEELLLFKTLVMDEVGGALDFRVDDSYKLVDEMEDELLRRKDKNPNTCGAISLGIGASGIDKIVANAESGATKLLLIFKQDFKNAKAMSDKLLKSAFTIVFSSYKTDTVMAADLVLPVAEYFETSGTFTNSKGMVQKFDKAVDAPGETREGWIALRDLATAMESKVTMANVAALTAAVQEKISSTEAQQK